MDKRYLYKDSNELIKQENSYNEKHNTENGIFNVLIRN